jgi:antitoxin YefM
MAPLRPSTDVRPVTEFRAHASDVLRHLHSTKRPVILTQNGRSAAVLLDVDVYEDLLDQLAFVKSVQTGLAQADAGRVVAHDDVEARLRERYLK